MEFAIKKNVSLSTLRRHIKAQKVAFKVENGRYLLFDDAGDSVLQPKTTDAAKLQQELQRAREEIAELKMLIALYEEKLPTTPAQRHL